MREGPEFSARILFLSPRVLVQFRSFQLQLGTDHLTFVFFSSRFSFYFLPIENQRFFFHSLRAIQDKAKTKYFFLNSIYLLDLYVRVFLESNIHRYIVYIICSCISWILGPSVYVHIKTFFNFSYLVTVYPVHALHFTQSGIHIFFGINCREKYVNERYSLGARNINFP